MKAPLESLLSEYAESHQNKLNQRLHKVCVPIIFFAVIGFLLSIPVQMGPIHFGDLVIALALGWYFSLGAKPFLLMLGQLAVCYGAFYALQQTSMSLLIITILFVLGWIGQFYGHHVEGRKPSFFKDLQFLLVGPLWVFQRFLK